MSAELGVPKLSNSHAGLASQQTADVNVVARAGTSSSAQIFTYIRRPLLMTWETLGRVWVARGTHTKHLIETGLGHIETGTQHLKREWTKQ